MGKKKKRIETELVFFVKETYQPEIKAKLEDFEREYNQIQLILDGFSNKDIPSYYDQMATKGCIQRKGEIKAMVKNINTEPEVKTDETVGIEKLTCKLDPIAYNATSENSNIIIVAKIKMGGNKYNPSKKKVSKIMLEVDVNSCDESGRATVFQREPITGKRYDLAECKELINKKLVEYDWVIKSDLY